MTLMNSLLIMFDLKHMEDLTLHPILCPVVDRAIKQREVKTGSNG